MQMPLLSFKNDRQPLLFESEDPREVWKLIGELQNKLPKALLFITKDLTASKSCCNKQKLKKTNVKVLSIYHYTVGYKTLKLISYDMIIVLSFCKACIDLSW